MTLKPRTGKKVMVGERMVVTFKPGRIVEERVAMERSGGQGATMKEASNSEERSW